MQLSGLISAQDLQLYYQIAYKGRADLQLAVTQEQGFEMTVLRLLAFRPLQPSEIPVMQETASQQATTHTTRLQPPVQTQLQSESIETQSLEAEPVFDDFSLDDGTDEEIDVASASGPSSDDFLDEEEPTSITAPESVQPVVIQTTIEEVQSSDQIVLIQMMIKAYLVLMKSRVRQKHRLLATVRMISCLKSLFLQMPSFLLSQYKRPCLLMRNLVLLHRK